MPLWSWQRALATKRFVWKGRWDVRSGWWTRSPLKSRPCAGFSFFQGVSRQGSTFPLPPLFRSLDWSPIRQPFYRGTRLSTTFSVSHCLSWTVHSIPPHYHSNHLSSSSQAHTTEPDPPFLFHPSSPLARRCLGLYLVHPSPSPLSYMLQLCFCQSPLYLS